jgi:hypothetical protein
VWSLHPYCAVFRSWTVDQAIRMIFPNSYSKFHTIYCVCTLIWYICSLKLYRPNSYGLIPWTNYMVLRGRIFIRMACKSSSRSWSLQVYVWKYCEKQQSDNCLGTGIQSIKLPYTIKYQPQHRITYSNIAWYHIVNYRRRKPARKCNNKEVAKEGWVIKISYGTVHQHMLQR